jgi:hypothetical protein
MPIPVAVLRQANHTLRERILDFLKKDPSQAYSLVEILGGIEGLEPTGTAVLGLLMVIREDYGRLDPIVETLAALEADGLIQSAEHQGSNYYAIKST